jgi:signal peptidase II
MQRRIVFFVAIALTVAILDQWTKYLATEALTTRMQGRNTLGERLKAAYGDPPPAGFDGLHFRPKKRVELIPNFLHVHYTENKGAAWGQFRDLPESIRGPLFHVISWLAIVLISYYFYKLSGHPSEKWALWGLPLVLGGAMGNYVDRLSRGFVIDFISAHWYDKAYWPSFNIADCGITVGVLMLLLDSFVRRKVPSAKGEERRAMGAR